MTRLDMSIKVERKLHDMRMARRIVRVRSTEQFVWHLLISFLLSEQEDYYETYPEGTGKTDASHGGKSC